MNEERGPWNQQCSNCEHYENGRCKLLEVNVELRDWCKDYE